MADVSVLVPVYNTELYLRECLDSIAAAVNRCEAQISVEVLLADDGSTDGSAAVLSEYAEQYPYMRLYRRENRGAAAERNFLLRKARGEYVLFVDSDDRIRPEMIARLLGAAREQSADIAVCDLEFIYGDSTKNEVRSCLGDGENLYARLMDCELVAASCNKLIRRGLFEGLRYPGGAGPEDIAVIPVILARAERIAVVNEPLYQYRQREGSIMRSSFGAGQMAIPGRVRLCLQRAEVCGVSDKKMAILRRSLYERQVLAVMLFQIRRLPFAERGRALGWFVRRTEYVLPDFWARVRMDGAAFTESRAERAVLALSARLVRRHAFGCVSALWQGMNAAYDALHRG